MLKIIVAVDGSAPARRAIETVGNMARAGLALEVVLLNVSSSPAFYGELTPSAFQQLDMAVHEQQAQVLEEALAVARASSLVRVVTQGVTGMAAPEIVRIAAESGADQLVLGTRGMGAMGSLLLGSVAHRVVHLATIPVLLVK